MKTKITTSLNSHFNLRACRPLLLALVCAATTGTCFAAKRNHQPNVESFSVVAAASRVANIQLRGTDADGDPLTYRIVSPPSHGTLASLVVGGPILSYTPFPDFLGTDMFFYTAYDGESDATLTAAVSITVKKGLEINNVSVTEGNSGLKTATFTVTMTTPGSELDLVVVSYKTGDGTALGSGVPILTGADYLATSGESSGVTLHLADSTGGGPSGQIVTINYSLSFKPHAAGQTFTVETFAIDDAGHEQGWEPLGTITVLPQTH